MASISDLTPEAQLSHIKKLHQELNNKRTFTLACSGLVQIAEKVEGLSDSSKEGLLEACSRTFTVLQTRYTSPKFWQVGLELFLALEFHLPSAAEKATQWREVAMQEVDEDAREQAEVLKAKLKFDWEKKFNQGRFCDAVRGFTAEEQALTRGFILVDADDSRPGMSRDARDELRLVTVPEEQACPICMEVMPLGSKSKQMPCGHLFHDDCIVSWVAKSNSCPMCRNDEMPSEKHHFDDVESRIRKEDPGRKGIFT